MYGILSLLAICLIVSVLPVPLFPITKIFDFTVLKFIALYIAVTIFLTATSCPIMLFSTSFSKSFMSGSISFGFDLLPVGVCIPEFPEPN